MRHSLARRVRRTVIGLYLRPLKLISRRGVLVETGWLDTLMTGRPTDRVGQAIPWWSYGATAFLAGRLTKNMEVFEYGSGFSTLWLARHVGHVTSVETDREWFIRIKSMVPGNVDLRYMTYEPNGEYCRLIAECRDQFDLIIIDSRDRVRCVKNALGALKKTGVLVFDDAHRPKLREGTEYLLQQGFRFIDFNGLGPVGDGWHCTRIFYRPENCLMI